MQKYADYLDLDVRLLETARQMLPETAQWDPPNQHARGALLVLWFLHKVNSLPELTAIWACGRLLTRATFLKALTRVEQHYADPGGEPRQGHALTLFDGRQLFLLPSTDSGLDLAERRDLVTPEETITSPLLSSSMWLENCYLVMRAQGL